MSTKAPTPKRDTKHVVRLVVIAAAAVLLIWFVIGNSQKVRVHFWVTSAETSLIVVILVSAALGALIALLLGRRKSKS